MKQDAEQYNQKTFKNIRRPFRVQQDVDLEPKFYIFVHVKMPQNTFTL